MAMDPKTARVFLAREAARSPLAPLSKMRAALHRQAHAALATEQAITDQAALQSEARHAARLEDERADDELTGDQAADALGRALQGIKDAHDGVWPF
jgi:hypothetical protein